MNSSINDILSNAPVMMVTVTALAAMMVEAVRKTRPVAVSVVSLAGLTAAAILAISNLSGEGLSFGGMIRHGGYANYFGALFCVAALMTVIVSRNYFEVQNYHRGEFYIMLLFTTVGMLLIASANDLIILFLGIELMSVCLYILAGFIRTKDRANEAALKYFLLGAFSTGFLLYGIALIYGATGTTNLSLIQNVFAVVSSRPIFVIGAGLIIVGLAFKAAVVPFHMWAPDVYEGAPTTVTAFMSTGVKAAAFAAFITIFIRTFDFLGGRINELMAILAAATMILGNITAIAQTNIKRMLAYSSIAHAGYMLTGIATGTLNGQVGVMFYLAAYTLMNFGAFAIISFVEQENDNNLLLDSYSGLSRQQPLLALLMAVFMFALAGVPPMAGFFGKYYVFLAAIQSHMTWLAIIGVLMSLVSAYYYLRVVVLMYFRDGHGDVSVIPSKSALAVVVFCAAAVIVLGLFPSFIVQIGLRFF
ncbi:MAG: NADH-quinone oxidoreductase subunit N [Ignavibacteriae bacterium]|nr:MAG: NADH-quinone oxidoreductase subunit N [Ignavibacteriota bacterium]